MSHSLHDFGFLGPIDSYAHGSRPCYQAGCKCLPCRSANACYEAQRAKARALGQWNGWVSPQAARTKLQELQALGVGLKHAARLAGVSARTIQRIRSGESQTIRAHVERGILGITKPTLAKGARVNGYETRHQLEILAKEGYAESRIAALLGLDWPYIRLHAATVRVSTALKVRAVFQHLAGE